MNRSDDSDSGADEDFELSDSIQYLFKPSLTVGSHFIDFRPEKELVFSQSNGSIRSYLSLHNITNRAPMAFYVHLLIVILLDLYDCVPHPSLHWAKKRFYQLRIWSASLNFLWKRQNWNVEGCNSRRHQQNWASHDLCEGTSTQWGLRCILILILTHSWIGPRSKRKIRFPL